jgi:hypothetical protein
MVHYSECSEKPLKCKKHKNIIFLKHSDVILFQFSPSFAHFIYFFLSRFVLSWIEISFVICACALSVLWSSACVFATQQWRFMDFEIRRNMNFGEVVLQFVQLFRLGEVDSN